MPWEIRENFSDCEDFAVVKIDDETIAGCHKTMEEAEAQLMALNISEAEEDKADNEEMLEEVEPEQKADEMLEVRPGFVIVETENDEVIAGHLTEEAANDELKELLEVSQEVEEVIEEVEKKAVKAIEAKAGRRLNSTMLKKLNEAIEFLKNLSSWGKYQDKQKETLPLFKMTADKGVAIKEVNGKPWIITWSSNGFEDRDKEIVSTKALENWSAKINEQENKGFFNLWHISNTDFAEKHFTMVPGRMLIEGGPFLDNAKGKAALQFFKQHLEGHKELAPEGWGCSIEFKYLPDEREKGIFENVEITRTSILPRYSAANIHTQIKELKMSMTKEQAKAAEVVFGKELANSLISGAESKSKELEPKIAHKEQSNDFTLDQIVEAVAVKMQLDIKPVTDALALLVEGQKVNVKQIKALQTQEAIKQETETPRYMLQLFDTAKESNKTKVSDDDDLIKSKPTETSKQDVSLAGSFFTGGK